MSINSNKVESLNPNRRGDRTMNMADMLVRCKRAKVDDHESRLEEGEDENNGRFLKLPAFHISELILEKLTPYSKDYFRFGAVCNQWFSVLMEDRNRRRSQAQQHQQLIPLLMVPMNTIQKRNKKVTVSRLYSVTSRKFMEDIDLRVTSDDDDDDIIEFCGSCYGWLIILLKSYEIVMYNPYNCQYIRLPQIMRALDKPPYACPDKARFYFWLDTQRFSGLRFPGVYKFVLSADPRTTDDYVVAAIFGAGQRLAFIKPKTSTSCCFSTSNSSDDTTNINTKGVDFPFPSWTYLEEYNGRWLTAFDDVIFYRGLVYAINIYHQIFIIQVDDLASGNGGLVLKVTNTIDAPRVWENGSLNLCWYLSETSTKELFLITRIFCSQRDGRISTKRFEVFKLTKLPDTELLRWVKVNSLDGNAVFIGGSQSISILASDSTGCQPDSIYFTDDHSLRASFGTQDMGIISLKEGSKSMHYTPDPACKHLPPPIWILPMF